MVALNVDTILSSIFFILPAYIANGAPTIFGRGGSPIDGGRVFKYDNRRILGDGKTWRGLYSGFICGVLAGLLEALFTPQITAFFQVFGITLYLDGPVAFVRSIVLSTGALLGDLIGSFVKRRIGMKRGQSAVGMDQLGFVITGFVLVWIFYPWVTTIPFDLFLLYIVFLIPVTFFVHVGSNIVAYLLGLKDVPW